MCPKQLPRHGGHNRLFFFRQAIQTGEHPPQGCLNVLTSLLLLLRVWILHIGLLVRTVKKSMTRTMRRLATRPNEYIEHLYLP